MNEMKWISLKDQIPEDGECVLLWDGNYYHVGEILYTEGDKIVFLCDGVCVEDPTFWQPLPPHPLVGA